MRSRVRIRLFHMFHFVMDFLFPLLKNSKSGVDDRGHRFRSGSPLTNYPQASAVFRVTFHCTEADLKLTHMAYAKFATI